MANVRPLGSVIRLIEYLEKNKAPLNGRAVDIGAGKGRNSVYLAECGYEVFSLEYIQAALDMINTLATAKKQSKVHATFCEIDKQWPFEDGFFNLAIDTFASIDVETKSGREMCRDEMHRTLKPGGYALVNVCSSEDEWERELIQKHPGPEPNSTIWPENGKFQKDYSEAELRKFYKKFTILELQTVTEPAVKLGRKGVATNFWLLLQKPG